MHRTARALVIAIVACVPPPEKTGAGQGTRDESPVAEVASDEFPVVEEAFEPPTSDAPCKRASELAEPLNPGMAGLGTMRLLEAVPLERGNWKRVSRQAAAADAKRWNDAVQAVVDDGRRRATISITDMKATCSLEVGMGTAMIERGLQSHGREPARVAGRPAVAFEQGAYRLINFWAGDRCAVTIGAPALSHADLVDVADALDLGVLDRVCAERSPG